MLKKILNIILRSELFCILVIIFILSLTVFVLTMAVYLPFWLFGLIPV